MTPDDNVKTLPRHPDRDKPLLIQLDDEIGVIWPCGQILGLRKRDGQWRISMDTRAPEPQVAVCIVGASEN